jgi:CheY-like chemotaxis protein
MDRRPKILLADDNPDLLDMFREMLAQLPSRPEIQTSGDGARALAMLEAEPFQLLICDLKMPKMDGLQVLAIVRRKYPQLRTVALTAEMDEQYRSRAYALGVDLFWHKPATEQETKMFLECIESLLGRETEAGFRGVQNKSLMDIIQLECISQSSAVLRITNGPLGGKIWIQTGELIDAEAVELDGEQAFQKILSWRAGNFEMLPDEPGRPRKIFKPYNALLLESAQALDESRGSVTPQGASPPPASPLAQVSQIEGVEFVLALNADPAGGQVARGLENPERMAAWARQSLERFRSLGDRLGAGALERLEGFGPQRHVTLAGQDQTEFCVGWKHTLAPDEVRELMKKVLALWAS